MKKTTQQQQQNQHQQRQQTVIICQSFTDMTDSISVENEDLFDAFCSHMFSSDIEVPHDHTVANSYYYRNNKRLSALRKCQKIEAMRPHLTIPVIVRIRFSESKQIDRAVYSMLRLMNILKKDYLSKVISTAVAELAIEYQMSLDRVKADLEQAGANDVVECVEKMFKDVANDPDQDIDMVVNAVERIHSSSKSWKMVECMVFIKAIQTILPYVAAYLEKGCFSSNEIMSLLLYARGWGIRFNMDNADIREEMSTSFLCKSLSNFSDIKLISTATGESVDAWMSLRYMIERNPLAASSCLLTVLGMAHALHVYRFGTTDSSMDVLFYMSEAVEAKWAMPKSAHLTRLMCGQMRKIVPCNHKDLRDFAAHVHGNLNDGKDRRHITRICTSFSGMPLGTLRDDDNEVIQIIENMLVRFMRHAWDSSDGFVRGAILTAYPDLAGNSPYLVSNWLAFELCYVRNLYPSFPEFMEFRHVPEMVDVLFRWKKLSSLLTELVEYQDRSLRAFHAELDNGLNNMALPLQPPSKQNNNNNNKKKSKKAKKANKQKPAKKVVTVTPTTTVTAPPFTQDDSTEGENEDEEEEDEDDDDVKEVQEQEQEPEQREDEKENTANPFAIASAPPLDDCDHCHPPCHTNHEERVDSRECDETGREIDSMFNWILDENEKQEKPINKPKFRDINFSLLHACYQKSKGINNYW